MKLIRKNGHAHAASVFAGLPGEAIGRRTFLRRSSLTMGGAAVAGPTPRVSNKLAAKPSATIDMILMMSVIRSQSTTDVKAPFTRRAFQSCSQAGSVRHATQTMPPSTKVRLHQL